MIKTENHESKNFKKAMSKFRVGPYRSLVLDMGYVIQKKKWWGWSNWRQYDYKEDAVTDAKILKRKGHTVLWYL